MILFLRKGRSMCRAKSECVHTAGAARQIFFSASGRRPDLAVEDL